MTGGNKEKGDYMTEPAITKSSDEESRYVRHKLIEFNTEHLPENMNRYEEINLNIKDADGRIVGGLLSAVCWNWMEIDILWVDQYQRAKGLGSKLLMEAERIAREKECEFVKLNTFSFQAPDFYKKHGYQVMAIIENAPVGQKHYYFRKEL